MGKVLDKLNTDLEAITDLPELIHNEKHMMGLLTKWEAELPEFKECRHDFIENRKNFLFQCTWQGKGASHERAHEGALLPGRPRQQSFHAGAGGNFSGNGTDVDRRIG